MFTQNHEIWNFEATDLLYILIEVHRNAMELEKCQEIGVLKGLCRVRIKYLLVQTISDKKWSNPVKLVRKRKV